MSSITHVVNSETEEILNCYEYDAWGNLTACEEKIPNCFKFNGQQYDPITQQYYLRARYYNPVIGRFTQEDTYRGDGLNLYACCANNPVCYVDPSGYFCEKAAERICKLIDEGRIKGKNRSKLYAYLIEQQRNGKIEPCERKVAVKLGINIRLIPGTPRIVTGGDSDILGENIFEKMELAQTPSRTGYQAPHIIPKEFKDHRILRKIGMDFDDASNGIFLRERRGGISTMLRHQGRHIQYSNVIKQCLDAMDISKSIPELEKEVYELQQAARRMIEAGIPIYMCDHVHKSYGKNGKIGKKSKKIYGASGSIRTEQFLRRMLRKYGF